jgi:purine-binding chemotaxis protein CheW
VTKRVATPSEMVQRDAARSRDLVAARTVALARRRLGGEAPERPTFPYLLCACGGERLGLPLARVARVLPARPCTPMPGAGPAVAGLVALSGRIVGVIDLARALGRPAGDEDAGHHVLRGEPPVAFAVGRALGIVRATRDPAPAGEDGAPPLGNGTASDYVPAADGHPDFVIVDPSPLLRRLHP